MQFYWPVAFITHQMTMSYNNGNINKILKNGFATILPTIFFPLTCLTEYGVKYLIQIHVDQSIK